MIDTRLELADRYLKEAKECISKGDSVQASEGLYKVAEECIKALAMKFRIPEANEAYREGRWYTRLLSRAAKVLSSKLDEPLINIAWSIAYDLHVWGFHEASLAIDHVRFCMPYVSKLFERTCELVRRRD